MRNKLKFEALRTLMAIGISLAILTIIIFFISKEPLNAMFLLFLGPLESMRTICDVFVTMVPIMFTGVGMCLILSSNSINLAPESALFFGAIVGTAIAVLVKAPIYILLPLVMLSATVAGCIVTGIPAYLKMKTKSDEMVISLMLNYIVFFFSLYILRYLIKDSSVSLLASHKIPKELLFSPLVAKTRLHAGIFIAFFVVAFGYLALYKTRWGLFVRITGENADFAKTAGINVKQTMLLAQLIGGAIAGLGGIVEILGLYKRFAWSSLTGFGWDGLLLATLARNNPLYIPVAAFVIAYLRIGSDIMSRRSDVPTEVLGIVQGIIIILIIAGKLTDKLEKHSLYNEAKRLVDKEKVGV